MLQYQTIPVTEFQQNCSLVWCDETRQATIIDPGGDLVLLLDTIAQLKVNLEQIWITHGHLDHAGATAVGRVVNGAVHVVREIAQVRHTKVEDALLAGFAHERDVEHVEELGKNGDNVNPQGRRLPHLW
jgi:glyoxylase-like metal-dependent hydrolase (beta-lactamase superfamily II)